MQQKQKILRRMQQKQKILRRGDNNKQKNYLKKKKSLNDPNNDDM